MKNILETIKKWWEEFRKDYKELYTFEKNNRKIYETRYKEINAENVKIQKDCKLLEKALVKTDKDNNSLKEEIAKIKIELEDTLGFLEQEKECVKALKKERKILNKRIEELENAITNSLIDNNEIVVEALNETINEIVEPIVEVEIKNEVVEEIAKEVVKTTENKVRKNKPNKKPNQKNKKKKEVVA